MGQYKNLGGNSGIRAYEIGRDYVKVRFNSDTEYLYTYQSAGSTNVEEMKKLAYAGVGLNSFIMRNVRTRFASKI